MICVCVAFFIFLKALLNEGDPTHFLYVGYIKCKQSLVQIVLFTSWHSLVYLVESTLGIGRGEIKMVDS